MGTEICDAAARTYNNERPGKGIGGLKPAKKLKWPREFYCGAPLKTGGLPTRRGREISQSRGDLVVGVAGHARRSHRSDAGAWPIYRRYPFESETDVAEKKCHVVSPIR